MIIPPGVTSIEERTFKNCSGLTSVLISSSIERIGLAAFSGCSGLTAVTIPSSVQSIDTAVPTIFSIGESLDAAFSCCSGLMAFSVDSANTEYCSLNGLLCTKNGQVLVEGVNGDAIIPEGVTLIGPNAFKGCRGLTSVKIPPSVKNIGDEAFKDCTGLKSVTIPDGVVYIGSRAFKGCHGLT